MKDARVKNDVTAEDAAAGASDAAAGTAGTAAAREAPTPRGGAPRAGAPRPGAWRLSLSGAVGLLALALGVSLVAAVGLGPVAIPFAEVWSMIADAWWPGAATGPPTGPLATIVLDIRLPRVLLGAVVGAGLAVTGAVMQGVLRNPLADPYLIGASSGASLGAVLALLSGAAGAGSWAGSWFGALSLPLSAFAGAMATFALVVLLARRGGQLATTRLILSGVAVAALAEAVTSFIVLSSPEAQLRSALFWTLGGLSGTQWSDLWAPTAVVLGAAAWFWTRAGLLNALVLGEEGATSLGVEVNRVRWRLIAVCAVTVGAVVSVSGGIGFVALMVPHAVRMLVGGDNRWVLPVSALGGALLMVWVDVGARMLNQPDEIPIGVITAVLGAPFFLALLSRSDRRTL
ncbi:iron complex transport system permease protein [Sinosporangium album]|uniref:Iron complex transport system permease protein n=1 Tax=Sinosporangium album TaxID=504805 RepID=A0A1G7ZTA3_9ACTN|nr:iron ABC transporter permease [Sinosporangium album]SDH11935.1 iron complex transport system permease protein [Sinosporangium album]